MNDHPCCNHHHRNDGQTEKAGSHLRFPTVRARIIITIPQGALSLPSLRSVFPGMNQQIGSTFDGVHFDHLTLVGKRVAVNVRLQYLFRYSLGRMLI